MLTAGAADPTHRVAFVLQAGTHDAGKRAAGVARDIEAEGPAPKRAARNDDNVAAPAADADADAGDASPAEAAAGAPAPAAAAKPDATGDAAGGAAAAATAADGAHATAADAAAAAPAATTATTTAAAAAGDGSSAEDVESAAAAVAAGAAMDTDKDMFETLSCPICQEVRWWLRGRTVFWNDFSTPATPPASRTPHGGQTTDSARLRQPHALPAQLLWRVLLAMDAPLRLVPRLSRPRRQSPAVRCAATRVSRPRLAATLCALMELPLA